MNVDKHENAFQTKFPLIREHVRTRGSGNYVKHNQALPSQEHGIRPLSISHPGSVILRLQMLEHTLLKYQTLYKQNPGNHDEEEDEQKGKHMCAHAHTHTRTHAHTHTRTHKRTH
jgi:hypothetical protein